METDEDWTMSGEGQEAILIVEDDAELRRHLAETTSRWGLRPFAAGDYSTGLRLARAHQPAYGLIDLGIPGGNGIQLIVEILAENKHARMLLITGTATDDDAVEAMLAGAGYVLRKPFTSTELARRLFPKAEAAAEECTPAPYTYEQVVWEHVHRVHRENGNNILKTARLIKLDRTTVKKWLRMPRPPR